MIPRIYRVHSDMSCTMRQTMHLLHSQGPPYVVSPPSSDPSIVVAGRFHSTTLHSRPSWVRCGADSPLALPTTHKSPELNTSQFSFVNWSAHVQSCSSRQTGGKPKVQIMTSSTQNKAATPPTLPGHSSSLPQPSACDHRNPTTTNPLSQ